MPKFEFYLKKILLLAPILLAISSCDPGCVEADEFDTEQIVVNARPIGDGIIGHYDEQTGGQVAQWHETGLRVNGDPIVALISGGWGAWEQTFDNTSLKNAPLCNMCIRKEGVPNCICEEGKSPATELDINGQKVKRDDGSEVNCSMTADQQNPKYCTCMYQAPDIDNIYPYTEDTDLNRMHYYIATDYQNKDGTLKIPDEQNFCKYGKGMGLYLGLFGTNGVIPPIRAYHLYSTNEICDIGRNAKGECVDSEGNDHTKYLYTSPNDKIFVKDDKSGNNGSDTDTKDDELHKPRELLKGIIYDRYYDDNFGYYTLTFLSGVQVGNDTGIMEYIVGTIEDVVLGKVNQDTGKRDGGILSFMYQAIVADSVFIRIVQVMLITYVTVFGFGVLAGVVEISKKEMMNRLLKIGLVIFFTTSTSWYWYDQFVVGFFKDGMDYMISLFMSLTDSVYGSDTSMIQITQMERAAAASNATRFAYADHTIKKLLSLAVTKKIWGLIFSSIFGILYIIIIYVLIAYFIYVCITIAFTYITALLKLVFALILGPLMILTSLFAQTSTMFKKWISFMAVRAFEIICLFAVFYLFLVLIDKGFTNLLTIRVCSSSLNVGFFSLPILDTESNRSLIEWLVAFLNIGLLIYLLQMTTQNVPGIANSLVSISGTASSSGADAFKDSNSAASSLFGGLAGHAITAGKAAFSTAVKLAPTSAIGMVLEYGGSKIPFRGPRGHIRDYKIDNAIKQATSEAGKREGSGRDQFIRARTYELLAAQAKESPNSHNLLGINDTAIDKRLSQKLKMNPLKDFIKLKAKELKSKGFAPGKEMDEKLKAEARTWAKNNLVDGSVENELKNLRAFIRKQGEYSGDEAFKNLNKQGADKYLDHLMSKKFNNKDGLDDKNLSKFLRKQEYHELALKNKLKDGFLESAMRGVGINPDKKSIKQRIAMLDKRELDDAKRKELAEEYRSKGYAAERAAIEQRYKDELKRIEEGASAYSRAEIEKMRQDERLEAAQKLKEYGLTLDSITGPAAISVPGSSSGIGAGDAVGIRLSENPTFGVPDSNASSSDSRGSSSASNGSSDDTARAMRDMKKSSLISSKYSLTMKQYQASQVVDKLKKEGASSDKINAALDDLDKVTSEISQIDTDISNLEIS